MSHSRSRQSSPCSAEPRRAQTEVLVGAIEFDGKKLAGAAPHLITRMGVGLVPEGRRLFSRLPQRAGALSGGEQQMLAIGRALMTQPRLLMLGELSQGIAPRLVDDILAAVGRIRALGVAVLLVEQRPGEALADRAYVLQTGRVVMSGPAAESAADDGVQRAYLGM